MVFPLIYVDGVRSVWIVCWRKVLVARGPASCGYTTNRHSTGPSIPTTSKGQAKTVMHSGGLLAADLGFELVFRHILLDILQADGLIAFCVCVNPGRIDQIMQKGVEILQALLLIRFI